MSGFLCLVVPAPEIRTIKLACDYRTFLLLGGWSTKALFVV